MSNNPYSAPQSNVSLGAKEDDYCEIKLFSVEGRLGRLRYFNRIFVASYLFIILTSIFSFIVRARGYGQKTKLFGWLHPDIMLGIIIVFCILLIATFVFSIIQRLHDTNRSGWFALLLLIPLINVLLGLTLLFSPSVATSNNFGAPSPQNTLVTNMVGGLFIILILLNILSRGLGRIF